MRCLLVLAALMLTACDRAADTNANAKPTPSVPAATVSGVPLTYSIVEKWSIANGGEGKVILIAPALATEEGMVALAQKLWYDTRNDRHAFIFIYDDIRAAKMYRDILKQQDNARLQIYDRHFMGSYTRNINTGFHHMDMHVQGLNGPMKQIDL